MSSPYNLAQLPIANVNFSDPLFNSLRNEYQDFDNWTTRALETSDSRIAFAIFADTSEYAAIAICKLSSARSRLKISTFKVSPSWCRSGLGTSLLSQIIALAVTGMQQVIDARIRPEKDDAIRFFERAGFRRQPGRSYQGEYIYSLELDNASSYSAINRIAYDQLADEYLVRALRPNPSRERPEYLSRSLTKFLPENSELPILELGPGSGDVLAAFANDGWTTVAVEISPRMAAIARSQSPTSTIIVADALDIGFPNGSFAGIYASAFFHLFPRSTAVELLSRAATWLRDDGLIFINSTIAQVVDEGLDLKADYLRKIARYRSHWTESELLNIVDAAGLKTIDRLTTAEVEVSKDWIAFLCAAK
jgi:SAM-dependent methyltransferase/RimJ/RimL family protein N-acetyltransferase